MDIAPNGRIIAAGYADNPNDRRLAVVAYNSSNCLKDTSFSGDGIQTTNMIGSFSEVIDDVDIDSSGRIVFAGHRTLGPISDSNSEFLVGRFTSGGALDTSFSGDGFHTFVYSETNNVQVATGVKIGSQGRINVGGYVGDSSSG